MEQYILHVFEHGLEELFSLRHQVFILEQIPLPDGLARILNYAIDDLDLAVGQTLPPQRLLNLEDFLVVFVPEGEEEGQS